MVSAPWRREVEQSTDPSVTYSVFNIHVILCIHFCLAYYLVNIHATVTSLSTRIVHARGATSTNRLLNSRFASARYATQRRINSNLLIVNIHNNFHVNEYSCSLRHLGNICRAVKSMWCTTPSRGAKSTQSCISLFILSADIYIHCTHNAQLGHILAALRHNWPQKHTSCAISDNLINSTCSNTRIF